MTLQARIARPLSALRSIGGGGLGAAAGRGGYKRKAVVYAALALAILFWAANGSGYLQRLAVVCGVFATLALSLNLAAGFLGQFSLGHSGLFAVGAYSAAIGIDHWHMSIVLALLFAIATTTLVGLALGAVSLRLGGLYFALVTLAFASVVTVIAERWTAATNGAAGLIGPMFPDFPAALAWAGSPLVWVAGLVTIVSAVLTANIRISPLYPVLAAIRESESVASAAGVRTARLKVGMFCLSAALAGVAGWMFIFLGFINPTNFQFMLSIQILVMVLLGGINTTMGPIVGAVAITLFPEYIDISPEWREWVYGALLILLVAFVPEGLIGGLRRGGRTAARRMVGHLTDLSAAARPGRRGPGQSPAAGDAPLPSGGEEAPSAAAVNGDIALEGEGISFRYESGVYALRDVGVRVGRGTIHSVIGSNGSGKSTLVSVLTGFLRAEQGTVSIEGVPVGRASPPARAMRGLVRTFQTAAPVGELTCLENCQIGSYRGVRLLALRAPFWRMLPGSAQTERALRQQGTEVLEWLGLAGWAENRADEVPDAVRRSLQLAACLSVGPSVIILDEPMAGLTGTEIDSLSERLITLRDRGVTIVLIEHHVRVVFGISDEITVLNAGKVIARGTPEQVRNNKAVQSAYLGTVAT